MKRREYSKILKEWNDFLLKEENRLLNEQLLLESFLLNEDLRDIANKYGRKGLLFLASLVLSNTLPSKNASAQPSPVTTSQYSEENPEKAKKLKRLAQDDEIVAQIINKTRENNQTSFKGFLKPEDLERFYRETGKKVFTQKNMSITKLPGTYIKETFELDKVSSKELAKILKKAKKIYNEKLDERTFLITVNGKKYAVVVESDGETNRQQDHHTIIRWSNNIANSITNLLITKINSNNKKLINEAKRCQYELALTISNMTINNSLRPNSKGGSFISTDAYFSYWARCVSDYFNSSITMPESVEFSFDNTSLMGVITLPVGFFEGSLGHETILIHELGHLLSDQSGNEIISTSTLKSFYKFLDQNNKTSNFNLEDIARFILSEELLNYQITSDVSLFSLSNKTKKIILKASKTFANQLLGSGSVEKIDNLNFSFTIGLKKSYYGNLEERIENIFSVVNSIDVGLEYESHKSSEAKLIKRKAYFKSLINDMLKSSFFTLDFDNIDSSSLNREKARNLVFNLFFNLTADKEYFDNFDSARFFALTNFKGFDKSPAEGARLLKHSLNNILKIVEHNNSHEGHNH